MPSEYPHSLNGEHRQVAPRIYDGGVLVMSTPVPL